MDRLVKFLQSSPPITTTGGGYMIYSFGLVDALLIRQIYVAIPDNIPTGYEVIGPIYLRAQLVGVTVQNFEIYHMASNSSAVTEGVKGFSSHNLNIYMPRGSLSLHVYPDNFMNVPSYDWQATIAYEDLL